MKSHLAVIFHPPFISQENIEIMVSQQFYYFNINIIGSKVYPAPDLYMRIVPLFDLAF
jgi:hypothetical protein